MMEDYEKSIFYNKKAADLHPSENHANHSDIGLAYYQLGVQQANNKHFETAFKFSRQALE